MLDCRVYDVVAPPVLGGVQRFVGRQQGQLLPVGCCHAHAHRHRPLSPWKVLDCLANAFHEEGCPSLPGRWQQEDEFLTIPIDRVTAMDGYIGYTRAIHHSAVSRAFYTISHHQVHAHESDEMMDDTALQPCAEHQGGPVPQPRPCPPPAAPNLPLRPRIRRKRPRVRRHLIAHGRPVPAPHAP